MSKILDYNQFIQHVGNKKLYKLFPKNLKCHNVQYKENETFTVTNFDDEKYDNGKCIILFDYVISHTYSNNYYYICEIIPHVNAKYIVYDQVIKTNIINVTTIINLSDFTINNIDKIYKFDIPHILSQAVENNHVDVIKAVYENNVKNNDLLKILFGCKLDTMCKIAFEHGYIDVVKFLHEKFRLSKQFFQTNHIYTSAFLQGHINIIEFLHKNIGFTKEDFIANNNYCCQLCCHNGYIDIIKYLHKEVGFTKKDFIANNNYCCQFGCYSGYVDIIKYLHKEVGFTKKDFELNNNDLYVTAYRFKHLHIVKYLLEEVKIKVSLYKKLYCLYWFDLHCDY